jgi:hypothetical protein
MYSAIYFPILRGKDGERTAVGHLSQQTRTRIRPMFDLSPYVGTENDSIEQHLAEVARKYVETWGVALPAFFDFSRYGPAEKIANGRHPCEHFFECARQLKLQGIPVAGPESHRGPGNRYLEAVAAIAHADQRGAAVRIPQDAITRSEHIADVVEGVATTLSLPTSLIDLFIDLEAIDRLPPEFQATRPLVTVVDEILNALDGMQFRNLIIAGCSLPEAVSPTHNWNALRVPRIELAVWSETSQRHRNLGFGDYGIAYAFESDSDGPVNPPSRVRISTASEYVLHRAPRDEYRQLCAHVIKTEDFDGSLRSWGAQEILQGGSAGPGAAREWVARDTNLHIERTRGLVEAELGRLGLHQELAFAEPEPTPYLQGSLEV